MKIAILTIGDEVIMGKIVNTNASYLAKRLDENHFTVTGHLAVRDTLDEIVHALDYLYKRASVVITTGGLGPTVDDLTKEGSAKYFNQELDLFGEQLAIVKGLFDKMNIPMPDNNKKQACFIKGSIVIKNDNGTAPGMIYEQNGKMVINLPGPPKELIPMLEDTVIPYLKEKENVFFKEKKYRLMNIGESHAETIIKPIYEKYPNIKIAPYASVGTIDYMISTNNEGEYTSFDACCEMFEDYLKDYIIGDWTKSIHQIVTEMLIEKNLKLAIAESCTGGMVTSSIVDVAGSSSTLLEGVVTYSNESKIKRLGVKEETLNTFGAVSEETAIEMAKGVTDMCQANLGISTTGIAGPGGGTKEKPVGLVYTAIYYKGNTKVFKYNLSGNRMKIRERTMMNLLFALYQFIKTL